MVVTEEVRAEAVREVVMAEEAKAAAKAAVAMVEETEVVAKPVVVRGEGGQGALTAAGTGRVPKVAAGARAGSQRGKRRASSG